MLARIWIWPLLIALAGCLDASPDADDAADPGATATTAAVPPSPTALTMTGLGPVHFGMTVAEAEHALGAGLEPIEEEACSLTRRTDGRDPGILYMVEWGKITRIDIQDMTANGTAHFPSGITSDKGIGIGATESDVLAAYGSATQVMPHKYDQHGHYLIVDSPDAKSALLFETSSGIVTMFRAGVHPSVDYVEGCS